MHNLALDIFEGIIIINPRYYQQGIDRLRTRLSESLIGIRLIGTARNWPILWKRKQRMRTERRDRKESAAAGKDRGRFSGSRIGRIARDLRDYL